MEIFGQPLDQDNVTRLYQDAATMLHLPFDEPPGARAFEDASLAHVAASCAGATCATSGTPGRLNQAAWFTGAPVQLGATPAASLVNNFTVAAWINPRSLTGWHRIVSSALTKSNNGWALGTNGTELVFTHFGVRDYTTAGAALKTNRWTHVAVVIDPMGHGTFLVNGAAVGVFTMSTTGLANPDDALLVGATTTAGATTPTQTFDGQIDDLWIFNLSLSADEHDRTVRTGPGVRTCGSMRRSARAGFVDNADADRKALCSAGACPSVGEAVRGQVGLAAEFDGDGDRLSMAAPALPNFTVGVWVMPTAANPTPVSRAGARARRQVGHGRRQLPALYAGRSQAGAGVGLHRDHHEGRGQDAADPQPLEPRGRRVRRPRPCASTSTGPRATPSRWRRRPPAPPRPMWRSAGNPGWRPTSSSPAGLTR